MTQEPISKIHSGSKTSNFGCKNLKSRRNITDIPPQFSIFSLEIDSFLSQKLFLRRVLVQKFTSLVKIIITTIYFWFALLPLVSLADVRIVKSVVPCGTRSTGPCQTCHLFELGHNIVDFLMWDIAGPLAALMFLIGGFFILTAGDSPQRRQQGISMFSSTLWGLAIVFFSWILINTIISVMGGKGIIAAWSSVGFCASPTGPQ